MPKDFYVKDIEGKEEITAGGWTSEGAEHWYSIANRKFLKIIN